MDTWRTNAAQSGGSRGPQSRPTVSYIREEVQAGIRTRRADEEETTPRIREVSVTTVTAWVTSHETAAAQEAVTVATSASTSRSRNRLLQSRPQTTARVDNTTIGSRLRDAGRSEGASDEVKDLIFQDLWSQGGFPTLNPSLGEGN